MNPSEKALQLIELYKEKTYYWCEFTKINEAVLCAIYHVKDVMNMDSYLNLYLDNKQFAKFNNYWQEVLTELEKYNS